MDVILLQRVEKLGQMGQVVKVRPGYARNYLLPQQKAMRATKENLSHFEARRAQLEAANLEQRKDAEYVAEKLTGTSVEMIRQAGESGVLYGSVSARDVSAALTEKGFTTHRSQVEIGSPIKTLGLFPVNIRLHPEVVVEITLNVARSEDEAVLQAERGAAVTAADLREEEEAAAAAEAAAERAAEEAAAEEAAEQEALA